LNKQCVNSLFAFAFTLLLFLQMFGPAMVYRIQRSAIRESVKQQVVAGIDQSDLVEIKIANHRLETDLTWEHEREFKYNGQWYDVVSSKQNGSSTIFLCYSDKQETELEKKFEEITKVEINSTDRQSQRAKFTQLIDSNYLSLIYCNDFFHTTVALAHRNHLAKTIQLTLDSVVPPPELS